MRTLALLAVLVALAAAWPLYADVSAPPRAAAPVVDRGEVLALADPITFAAARPEPAPGAHAALDALAAYLERERSILAVEIQVHSDARGAEAYNLRLTEARAQAVRAYLVARGVAAGRLRAKGYGETRPVCREPTAACSARNRRVEIHVLARAGAAPPSGVSAAPAGR